LPLHRAKVEYFANPASGVSVVFEKLGEGNDIWVDGSYFGFKIPNASSVGPESCENTGAGGPADRLLAVGIREGDSLTGQPVDMGRFDDGVAVASEIWFKVINRDKKDIGTCCSKRSESRSDKWMENGGYWEVSTVEIMKDRWMRWLNLKVIPLGKNPTQ